MAEHPLIGPTTKVPSVEEFLPYIEKALKAVHARLERAGHQYGEDVLFELGEDGAVTWAYTKAARILWSFKSKQDRESRQDSYLDLAGYAVLEMARYAYETGKIPDGLFDRPDLVHGHVHSIGVGNITDTSALAQAARFFPDPHRGPVDYWDKDQESQAGEEMSHRALSLPDLDPAYSEGFGMSEAKTLDDVDEENAGLFPDLDNPDPFVRLDWYSMPERVDMLERLLRTLRGFWDSIEGKVKHG